MDELKNIVNKVLASITSQHPRESKNIQEVWDRITSPQEREHSKISGFKDGTLFVNVDSSAWLYQFKLKQGKLVAQIQSEASEIKKIIFKTGTVT